MLVTRGQRKSLREPEIINLAYLKAGRRPCAVKASADKGILSEEAGNASEISYSQTQHLQNDRGESAHKEATFDDRYPSNRYSGAGTESSF